MLDSKGNHIKIGDSVLFENGQTSGVVTGILESALDLKTWAVEAKGIMIESKPFGMLFLPVSSFIADEVRIVSVEDVANGDKY